MTDYDETDSVVDAVRERRRDEAEALAEFAQPDDTPTLTDQENERIRGMEHRQWVTWGYLDEEDWRRHA